MAEPQIEQNKYAPFTYEEFKVIQAEMGAMGYWLPKDITAQTKLWQNCTRIRGVAEKQPCPCRSSAGLWERCVKDINDYIKDRI